MHEDRLIFSESPEISATAGVACPTGRRIAGVGLLGGSVRPKRFHTAVARSPLDLPYQSGRTLLDAWCDQVSELASQRGGGPIPLRVLTDQGAAELGALKAAKLQVQVDRDPSEWRGTGGVLRDISVAYAPEDLLLVANAAQFLLRPLAGLVAELDALQADVAVLAHADGTPSTLMLVRCGCLTTLPEVGFMDMKEQAIPRLAARHTVRVVCVPQAVTRGLRTAQSYIEGLRALHARSAPELTGDQGEDWQSTFEIVEEGAKVEPGARLHNSVVLRGATVGRGAVLVRSVVCSGAAVLAGRTMVDKVVSRGGVESIVEDAQ